MAKASRMAGPGLIVNRHAKNSKIEIAFDPSPDGFVSTARRENARLKLVIVPGTGDIDPIEITVTPKIWVFKFERAQIPPDRLADLEALITEEQDVHVVIEYTPQQAELPFSEHTIDADGFVSNPTVIEIPVPDFLKAECKLMFACIEGMWHYGYEISGRVKRSRRVGTLLTDGWAELSTCLHDLSTSIEEALCHDDSRLAEFLVWKIDGAAKAVEEKDAGLAEAMAEPVHLPADFAQAAATEGTEGTEQEDAHAGPQGRRGEGLPTGADWGDVATPEILTVKAHGVKQAVVTVRLQRRGGDWRYGFEWQLGNFAGGERLEDSDWYAGRSICLHNLLSSVAISLASIQITGKADHRRSVETRRDTLREQFEDWLEPMIDAAEADETGHGSPVTGDEDGNEAEE